MNSKKSKENNRKCHIKNIEIAQKIPHEKFVELYQNPDWNEVKRALENFGLDFTGINEEKSYKKGWEEWQDRGPRHEGPYVPPPNPPAIIKVYRKRMNQDKTDELISLYYEYLEKIQNKKLDKSERLMYCSLSFPLLESLIKDTVENYGRFDIQKIPALEFAIDEFIAQGIKGQLLNIKDIVNYFPELKPWKDYLTEQWSNYFDE